MFSIAKKAASRLRFANLFNRAIGLTTTTNTGSNNAPDHHHFPSSSSTHHAKGVRTRRRRVSALHDATTAGDAEQIPNSRLLTNLRDQYRGATAVRTRVRKHNELRKERSLQRVLRTEHAAAASGASTPRSRSTTATAARRSEFHILAGNVRHALVTSETPKTQEDIIFERGLEELVGDFVAAKKVVDAELAKEVATTFDQIDAEDFMVQLDEERARVESAMAVKEVEEKAEREEKEREREMLEERERQKALEEIRLVNQGQIQEAERKRAEARRKADEAAILAAEEYHQRAEERVRQLREEHEVRLQEERRLRDKERQARVEAERTARLERERVARLEEEARLAREREEQRLREAEQARSWIQAEAAKLDAEFRAAEEEKARQEERARAERRQREADDNARQRLDEYVQSILDPELRGEANQRFQAQENHLRAHLEEAAMAQAQEQWFYVQQEHYWQQQQEPAQDFWSDFIQDTPMRDLSDIDVSMASVPPLEPSVPQFALPQSDSEWFNLYETRWQELRSPNTSELNFPSFPWPVFRFIPTFEELDDEDIKRFFASKYPGRLDKNWKVELTRWHPDKVERLRTRIRPDYVEFVRMGFLKCTMVMNAFQEEKEAGRT